MSLGSADGPGCGQDRVNNVLLESMKVREELDRLRAENAALRGQNKALSTALRDAISTYTKDDRTVIVTEERQETWIDILEKHGTAEDAA